MELVETVEQSENKHPKVLVVDDDERVRATLRAVLEVNEFQVTTAPSVNEAVDLIVHETFDVLLCDLHMAGCGRRRREPRTGRASQLGLLHKFSWVMSFLHGLGERHNQGGSRGPESGYGF